MNFQASMSIGAEEDLAEPFGHERPKKQVAAQFNMFPNLRHRAQRLPEAYASCR